MRTVARHARKGLHSRIVTQTHVQWLVMANGVHGLAARRLVEVASSSEATSSQRSLPMVVMAVPQVLRSRTVTQTLAQLIARAHGSNGAHAQTLAGQERSRALTLFPHQQIMVALLVRRHRRNRNANSNHAQWTAQGLTNSGVHAQQLAVKACSREATTLQFSLHMVALFVLRLLRSRLAICSLVRWTAMESGVNGAHARKRVVRGHSPGFSVSRHNQRMAVPHAQNLWARRIASCKIAQLIALVLGVNGETVLCPAVGECSPEATMSQLTLQMVALPVRNPQCLRTATQMLAQWTVREPISRGVIARWIVEEARRCGPTSLLLRQPTVDNLVLFLQLSRPAILTHVPWIARERMVRGKSALKPAGVERSPGASPSTQHPQTVEVTAQLLPRAKTVIPMLAQLIAQDHGMIGASARPLAAQVRSRGFTMLPSKQQMVGPRVLALLWSSSVQSNPAQLIVRELGGSGLRAQQLVGQERKTGNTLLRHLRHTEGQLVLPRRRPKTVRCKSARCHAKALGTSGAHVLRLVGWAYSSEATVLQLKQRSVALLPLRLLSKSLAISNHAQLMALGLGDNGAHARQVVGQGHSRGATL